MSEFRVIPYAVKNVQEQTDEIPQGLKTIEAPYLWEEGYKGEDIVVAVLDTGVQRNHPDLQGRIIGGLNFTSDYGDVNNYEDNNGHGTHVAGTIAAAENGFGIVGVAPKVKLLILKVLNGQGSGSYAGITDAIKYATNWEGPNGERVRVISMSLGGPEKIPEMHDAILGAIDKQIPVVVAAGNEGDNGNEETFEFSYPGSYNEVIEVAASDHSNKLADFSNNNDEVDVIAPGVDIKSTWPGSRYATISGTSMATPHVAGVLALLIQQGEKEFNRTLTEAEIYALLVKRTVPMGYKKSSEGHGLIRLGYMERVRNLLNFVEKNFA